MVGMVRLNRLKHDSSRRRTLEGDKDKNTERSRDSRPQPELKLQLVLPTINLSSNGPCAQSQYLILGIEQIAQES